MFTYIRLKNFMSFGEIEFNFKKNAKTTKKFVAIYGENGSGKSNFIQSIELLLSSLFSFENSVQIQQLLEIFNPNKDAPEPILRALEYMRSFMDISNLIKSSRLINSIEPTEVEYGFLLNQHEGYYRLKFTDRFVEEELYGYLTKKRGKLFRISALGDEIQATFWNGLFLNKKARIDFQDEIIKYWGKHTFLGIIRKQSNETNKNYIMNSLAKELLDTLNLMINITIFQDISQINATPPTMWNTNLNILNELKSGKIAPDMLPQLYKTEEILRDFFTQSYADIKDVYYMKEELPDGKIKYQLYIDKMIAGQIRRINFAKESAGTQRVLEIFQCPSIYW